MSYVPPHLRKASISKDLPPQKPPPRPEHYAIRDIQHHYWHRDENESTVMPQHSTLNDSIDHQGQLTHVLLFQGANPRWESERIIFVKSNLSILPRYHEAKAAHAPARADVEEPAKSTTTSSGVKLDEIKEKPDVKDETIDHDNPTKPPASDSSLIDITPTDPRPIACFTQSLRTARKEGFTFAGYYTISHIALLAPRSKELTRMLEQKWSHEDKRGNAHFAKRSQGAWEESLSYEWAVIKFEKMEGHGVPELPKIERLPKEEWKPRGEERETRSVNELLAEMRMK